MKKIILIALMATSLSANWYTALEQSAVPSQWDKLVDKYECWKNDGHREKYVKSVFGYTIKVYEECEDVKLQKK